MPARRSRSGALAYRIPGLGTRNKQLAYRVSSSDSAPASRLCAATDVSMGSRRAAIRPCRSSHARGRAAPQQSMVGPQKIRGWERSILTDCHSLRWLLRDRFAQDSRCEETQPDGEPAATGA